MASINVAFGRLSEHFGWGPCCVASGQTPQKIQPTTSLLFCICVFVMVVTWLGYLGNLFAEPFPSSRCLFWLCCSSSLVFMGMIPLTECSVEIRIQEQISISLLCFPLAEWCGYPPGTGIQMLGNLEWDFWSCEPLSPGASVAEAAQISHSHAFAGVLLAAEPAAGSYVVLPAWLQWWCAVVYQHICCQTVAVAAHVSCFHRPYKVAVGWTYYGIVVPAGNFIFRRYLPGKWDNL